MVDTLIPTNANQTDAQTAVGEPRHRDGRCSPPDDFIRRRGIGLRTSGHQGRRRRIGCARQLKAGGRLLNLRNASLPPSRGYR